MVTVGIGKMKRLLHYDARMLTRRAFLSTAAGSAAVLAAARSASGAQYDLLVKGGRVIDPSRKFDAMADVAVTKGRIAAVQPSIPASAAAEVVDATGALVTPGLIDIHTHVRSAEMPGICLSQGVTSLVDAGSRGADRSTVSWRSRRAHRTACAS